MRARLPPPGRTRPFSARSVESSSPPCPHATQPVRLLPYWDVSAIFVLPSPSDACAPLPAGEDRRRAPTRFVREARGATRVARASAEPACRPSLGPPPGPRGRRFGPPGSKRAVLTPPSGAFVDPTSSRSSLQKYLFTRSLPQVVRRCAWHVVRVYGPKASKMSQKSVSRVCCSSAASAGCQDAPLARSVHSVGPRECTDPTGVSRLDAVLEMELPQTRRRACHRRRPGGGDGV